MLRGRLGFDRWLAKGSRPRLGFPQADHSGERERGAGSMGVLVDLVQQHYANMSRHDPELDRDIMSPDVVTVDPTGLIEGIEGFLDHEIGFLTAFPDARAEMLRAVESGEMVM